MATDSVGQIGLDLVVNKKEFEVQMAGVQGLAKKAGLALAAAFSVKKLVDFSKECLDLGSQLAEVDNVIQQAVPSMESAIDKFAKNAIMQFGMSETAAKRYAGVFSSMARGFRFSEEAAASMGITLTGLAADVASFYDTSQEEAFTKLKGVFTGETEALKGLGIVMTQSALDAFAMANGYGKTTKAMSEAEKVALRYAYVQDQLRFAEGDFARTSGSWANQVRILKEQFDALKATIGQGLINVLTPVIQVINTIISKLMSLANAFKAFTEMLSGNRGSGGGAAVKAAQDMAAVEAAADKAAGAIGGTGGAAKKAAKEIKGAATGIDELNIIDPKTDSGGGGGSGGGYNPDEFDMGELDTTPVDELESKYSALIDRLKELGGLFAEGFKIGFGDTSVLESIRGHLDGIKTSLRDIFLDAAVQDAANRFLDSFAFNTGKVAGSVASVGATIADNVLGGVDKYLKQNSGRIKKYLVSMFDIGGEIAGIAGNFSEAAAYIFSAFRSDDAKQITADIIGIFSETFMGITELKARYARDILDLFTGPIIENKELIKTTLEDYFSAIGPSVTSVKLIVEDVFSGLKAVYDQHVQPLFQSLRDGFTDIMTKLLEVYNQYFLPVIEDWSKKFEEFRVNSLNPLMEKFGEFAGKVIDAVKELWEGALLPFILWFIETAAPLVSEAIQNMQDVFFLLGSVISTVIGVILDVLGGLIDFVAGVLTGDWERAWEGIKTIFSSVWEGIKSILKTLLEYIVVHIEEEMEKLRGFWSDVWTKITGVIRDKWNQMKSIINTHIEAIRAIIAAVLAFLNADWEERWTMIKDFASTTWGLIKDKATEIFEAIREKLAEIWQAIREVIEEKWNAIKEWFDEIWTKIKGIFNLDEMVQVGKNIMTSLWDGLKAIWEDIAQWLSGIAEFVGNVWSGIVDGAKNMFSSAKEDAESSGDDGDGGGYVDSGPGVKGHSTGGFPSSGQMYIANEDGKSEYLGSWGGKAAVANNGQITEGITRAVQYGMRSAIAPLVNNVQAMAANAAPPLATVGSVGGGVSDESRLQEMVNRAVAISQQGNSGGEQHLSIMVELLRKIIELIENLDLVVNIDIREMRKKLKDLESRSGYSFT